MRAYNWLGHGWTYADDSRIVVRTALFTPVLCAVDVGGVETTLGHSSAGTPECWEADCGWFVGTEYGWSYWARHSRRRVRSLPIGRWSGGMNWATPGVG